MAEGVTVLKFFLAEEGAGTNAFIKKLEAFIHCINVGCGDGEEVGDRRKVDSHHGFKSLREPQFKLVTYVILSSANSRLASVANSGEGGSARGKSDRAEQVVAWPTVDLWDRTFISKR